MSEALSTAVDVLAAALGGLAVGIERERSGHASGPAGHFGGMRTFALLGGCAGLAGQLWTTGQTGPATVLLLAAAALVVAGYLGVTRRDVDATTEVAALVVLAAGFFAGLGQLTLASGAVAMTVLILLEKSRLHGWAARLNDAEVRAAARFAVMAVVVLPLLPEGPYGPFGGVQPRQLWALVLLFAGIGFAGYIARRLVGAGRGYPLAGLLGGLVSSTQVTLAHAQASQPEAALRLPLACGALAASTVLFARTLVTAAVLDIDLARALVPYCAAPFAVGLVVAGLALRRSSGADGDCAAPTNPLQLRGALQMALLFQVVLLAVSAARSYFGAAGVLTSAAVVGLTDVDAVTVSVARLLRQGADASLAATAIGIGIVANTVLKTGLAAVIGRGTFRVVTVAGLIAINAALLASLLMW